MTLDIPSSPFRQGDLYPQMQRLEFYVGFDTEERSASSRTALPRVGIFGPKAHANGWVESCV
jgi:hypothetical protein